MLYFCLSPPACNRINILLKIKPILVLNLKLKRFGCCAKKGEEEKSIPPPTLGFQQPCKHFTQYLKINIAHPQADGSESKRARDL